MPSLEKTSALYRFRGESGISEINGKGVSIEEILFPGFIRVQLSRHMSPLDVSKVGKILGCDMPDQSTSRMTDNLSIFWLSERDWLVMCDPQNLTEIHKNLTHGLDKKRTAVIDVSDSKVVMKLEGENVADLLSIGCDLDLQPSVFSDFSYAKTVLAQVGIILQKTGRDNEFLLLVDRAYASYLWSWFLKAIEEF